MFIARVAGCSALRRRAMCSLKWRQPQLFACDTDGHGPPNGGRMLRPILAINMALLTEGKSPNSVGGIQEKSRGAPSVSERMNVSPNCVGGILGSQNLSLASNTELGHYWRERASRGHGPESWRSAQTRQAYEDYEAPREIERNQTSRGYGKRQYKRQ